MKSLLFIGLGALAACAANATSVPQALAEAPAYVEEAPEGLSCNIIRTRTSRGVELRAVASSDFRAMGAYEFVITKRDRGGSSDIAQSGEFDLAGGESASLGSAEISVGRGGDYDARLELTSADGETCMAEQSR